MNIPLVVDDMNKCLWGPTPWDSRALNLNTAAIYDITYDSALGRLFDMIEHQNCTNNIQLAYFRHDANDQFLKKAALVNGFHITEMSIIAHHNDISTFNNPDSSVSITPLLTSDLNGITEVKRIAGEVFNHGRFHEDPHIDLSLASKRFSMWIDDLAESAMLHTYRENERILGFFSFKETGEIIDIPLNGLDASTKGRGRSLMSATMNYIFNNTGLKKIKIQISSANMAALNMYARMGFSFALPTFGYHKYY